MPAALDRHSTVTAEEIVRLLNRDRQRMDDYRAIIPRSGKNSWANPPEMVYRKGGKFCLAWLFWCDGYPVPNDSPAENDVMGVWWRRLVAQFPIQRLHIYRDQTLYNCHWRHTSDLFGVEHAEIDSVTKQRFEWPPYEEKQPELICRPLIPIYPNLPWSLDLHPDEGPPGTVLIDVEHPLSGRRYRYWFDPARDYIVVRYDYIDDAFVPCCSSAGCQPRRKGSNSTASPPPKQLFVSRIVEETARSPSGILYVTRFRQRSKLTSRDADELPHTEESDSVNNIHVDFDREIPDELFDIPAVGDDVRLFPCY